MISGDRSVPSRPLSLCFLKRDCVSSSVRDCHIGEMQVHRSSPCCWRLLAVHVHRYILLPIVQVRHLELHILEPPSSWAG